MLTDYVLRSGQKNVLNILLELKRKNRGIKINGLDDAIHDQRAIMLPEDFAYVQKLVEEADDED